MRLRGGRVRRGRRFGPTLKVTTRDVGEAVEIRVRDNGTGIPPDIRDKLFQPFFTTKPTGEGTGLGLSITYDIVTKPHGGTITSTARSMRSPNSSSPCRARCSRTVAAGRESYGFGHGDGPMARRVLRSRSAPLYPRWSPDAAFCGSPAISLLTRYARRSRCRMIAATLSASFTSAAAMAGGPQIIPRSFRQRRPSRCTTLAGASLAGQRRITHNQPHLAETMYCLAHCPGFLMDPRKWQIRQLTLSVVPPVTGG